LIVSLLALFAARFHPVAAPNAPIGPGIPPSLPTLPGTVIHIVDGDTADVQLASGRIRVRFHGIDTPERKQPGGSEATAALTALIADKDVDLEPFEQDHHDRLVARVYIEGNDVNGALIQQGHAWAYREHMTKDDAAYCEYEHDARTHGRGLWALPPEQRVAPWEWRHPDVFPTFTDYSNESVEHCVAAIGIKATSSPLPPAIPAAEREVVIPESFACGTKMYCREMTWCEEALFYMQKCGLTRLDGDGDGVPCEDLCRKR
jgi:endonuclease YncB( thermonuclease family)